MKKLDVGLDSRSYTIHIGHGLLKRSGELISAVTGSRKAVVLSDDLVWPLYGDALADALRHSGIACTPIVLQNGEGAKRIANLERLLEFMAEYGLTRDDLLIALGGGVMGDLGGFAAAAYMRGISYVQIPTTLLAQVDSSVGGKTAVNLTHGKNLAGAFWQPKIVIADIDTLKTLPEREVAGGMAEVIKYAVIRSKDLFDTLARHPSPAEIQPVLADIIYTCCDIKREIVERDERDTGERMLLNLGHTFGHAIEKLGNYQKFIHGEAVALGLTLAARYGEMLGVTPKDTSGKIQALCRAFSLPMDQNISPLDIAPLAGLDKKAGKEHINLVLIREIGEAFIHRTALGDFSRQMREMAERNAYAD